MVRGTTITASLLTGLGVDEFFARTEGASTQHFLTDALGSTVRLTNSSAAKIVDYTYEPYGKASADAASTNAFQYTGRENDGTGLNYYRARYQHPVLGRFVSEDPIGLEGGLNVYAYVDSNPLSSADPSGLQRQPGQKTNVIENQIFGAGGGGGFGGGPSSSRPSWRDHPVGNNPRYKEGRVNTDYDGHMRDLWNWFRDGRPITVHKGHERFTLPDGTIVQYRNSSRIDLFPPTGRAETIHPWACPKP